jgi:Putative transmembrane protein (PGPGW)
MYFLLVGMIRRFAYLRAGLALLLAFIGVKMLIVDLYELPVWGSLAVIAIILSASVIASLRHSGPPSAEPASVNSSPGDVTAGGAPHKSRPSHISRVSQFSDGGAAEHPPGGRQNDSSLDANRKEPSHGANPKGPSHGGPADSFGNGGSPIRPHIEMSTIGLAVKRLGVTAIGALLVAAGLALLVLPGPGLVVIACGLTVLSTQYEWAKKLLDRVRRALPKGRGQKS